MQEIDCRGCRLRPWRLTDKDALIRHANNRKVWRNLRDIFPHPYTAAAADAWLAEMAVERPPEWYFAIDVEGEAVGSIALRLQGDIERHSAEIGYWLGEAFWGRGIMTAAVGEVTRRALAAPEFHRLEASVFAWNAPSMRVLEKAGYRREGVLVRSGVKDGVLMDRVLYAVTRDPGLPYVPAL